MWYRHRVLLVLLAGVALHTMNQPGTSADTPTTHRPYRFGYKVPGNQHRQEMKDANGKITGEFGFMTGDGTYHEARYATDEFGHYRLISSKSSYRYNPDSATADLQHKSPEIASSRAGKSLDSFAGSLQERNLISPKYSTTKKLTPQETYDRSTIQHSDSSNGAEFNTNTAGPYHNVNIPQIYQYSGAENKQSSHETTAARLLQPSSGSSSLLPDVSFEYVNINDESHPSATVDTNHFPLQHSQKYTKTKTDVPTSEHLAFQHNTQQNQPTASVVVGNIVVSTQSNLQNQKPSSHVSTANNVPSQHQPKHTKPTKPPTPATPTTPKIIRIPESGNYFIHIPPNVRTSLGITGDLLYVFNYATTFHGHNERGYRDGAKEGAYFTVNRDKVRRTVHYKLSSTNEVIRRIMEYEVVADKDTPTELSDKAGVLERNEFKWH